MIIKFKNIEPKIHESAFIAETGVVAGDVALAENTSVWFGATVRGDIAPVRIGKNSNVQEAATVHVSLNLGVTIGENVTIGHGAIIHGCTIGNNTLIGMGAIILDGAAIGSNCIIGAGALVTPRTQIPDGSLVVGSPAQVKRPIKEEEVAATIENAREYAALAREYKI